MLVYPICIQTYDQVSILRIWSKLRLHPVVLLGFGLKELKITMNILQIAQNPLKVCMHGYLSKGYLNSLSNFNYKKAKKITSLLDLYMTNLE